MYSDNNIISISNFITDALLQYDLKKQKTVESKISKYVPHLGTDPESWKFYQKSENFHWAASKFGNFSNDKNQYESHNTSEEIKRLVREINGFFLVADGMVVENIKDNFLPKCESPEENAMFISQTHIEVVHIESYGIAAITMIGKESVIKLIEGTEKSKAIAAKLDFTEKWIKCDCHHLFRLIAFCCIEGIFFHGLFAIVFYFKKEGLFDNFCALNGYIRRDEGLHCFWQIFLVNRLLERVMKINPELIHSIRLMITIIVESAVATEDTFIDELKIQGLGELNTNGLKNYIRVIANRLLIQLGNKSIYKTTDILSWMLLSDLEDKTNYYEQETTAYTLKPEDEINNPDRYTFTTSCETLLSDLENEDF